MMARLKPILGLLALALFASAAGAAVAPTFKPVIKITPIPPVGPSPITPDCRYLFVVDMSSAMQRSADGLYRTTHRLVASGLGGRMREGEVFTVWTYADTVLTREFPLNAWTPDLNIALANRTYEFLAQQKFRGKSNLRPVFAELSQALAIATNLTVILISDGTDVIVGTPFDRAINVTYGKRASEMRASRMPFITSLVTQRGEFTHWAVRGGLEDIGLPVPEKPALPAPLLAQPPAVVTPAPTPIVSTPKPVTPTNTPPPVVAVTPPPKPAPASLPPTKPVETPKVVTKATPPAATSTNASAAKPPETVAPKPPPASVPISTPAPKAVTNAVAITPPAPKLTPLSPPQVTKPPEPTPVVATAKKTEPGPSTTPAPKKPDPNLPLPAPAPKQEAKAAAPPPPKPVIETPKTPASTTKPAVTLAPSSTPAPPASQPVVLKSKEELVMQPIPSLTPPPLRQPKSAIDASNALAKVELLRPSTSTSAPPAKPLEARVIEPKPAPPKTTNTTVAVTKRTPPPATNAPVVKAATNTTAVAATTPKTIPIIVPSATTQKPPAPKPSETKSSVSATNTQARTTNSTLAVVLPLPKEKGRNEGKQVAAVTAKAPPPSKPAPPETKKRAPAIEVKALPAIEKPAQTAGQLAVASPGARRGGWGYLAAAVGLLVLAGGIIAHLLRPRPHPSVISQSLDDNRV